MSDYDDKPVAGKKPDMRTKASRTTWQRCQDRWRRVNDIDGDNLKAAKEDTEFVWVRGKQWPDAERLAREANQRPWLEINQMPQFVNLVVNEQRQSRPSIKIRPDDDDATKEMAEVTEQWVRAVERDSKAAAVYDTGFEHAVTSGRGYWRIATQYESDTSFNQTARIVSIKDPLSVRLDPDYQMPDASDIEWGYVLDVMDKDDFKRKYPNAQPLDFGDADATAVKDKWVQGERGVIVADYFEKAYTPKTLVLLDNGKTAFKDDMVQDAPVMGTAKEEEATYGGAKIIDEREVQQCRVDWFKVYGGGLLEQLEWAGKYIPIVMVIGVETVIDGKRIYQGLIRRARDVQTMYNFWETKATEQLALAPNAQWLTPKGSVEGYENVWDTANVRYMTRLPYNDDPNRRPPQRLDPVPAQTGVLEQANQCRQDFYTTIGIYPPNLAQQSNVEVSGIAEKNRRTVGQQQTFHFADNLARAIEHTGCILVDLMPKLIDTAREIPQVAYDGKTSTAKVNQFNPVTGQKDNPVGVGSYKVVVDVGPGYLTRRQETAEQMLLFMQAYPAAAPLLGDLLARAQDWDEADKIAARLQVMLPPQIQMMEQQAQGDPKYAGLLAQLQTLQQHSQGTIQALQDQLQQSALQVKQLQVQVLNAQAQAASTKASAATGKVQAAKAQLGAVVGQHNAEIRAAAESERTDIEAYNAQTQRLGEALDFLLGLIDAHQKQAQINTAQVSAEAASLQPEANAIAGKP